MRAIFVAALVLCWVGAASPAIGAGMERTGSFPLLTNIAQLRAASAHDPQSCYSFLLTGNVRWVNPGEGRLVLQDDSGAEVLELDLDGTAIHVGERVRLSGNGTLARTGAAVKLGVHGAVVDNDGLHGMFEKVGTIYLEQGRHPLRLDWFNRVEKFGLEVEFEGPGLPRQKIPDSALWRVENQPAGQTNLVNGLDVSCYEGEWEALPDLRQLVHVKTGITSSFTLETRSRDEHVALEFQGFLEVPQDGLYTFHLTSDDGSILYFSAPSLKFDDLGNAPLPSSPRLLAIGQTLSETDEVQWAELSGRVSFVRNQGTGMQFELTAGAGRVRVDVADRSGLSSPLEINSQVKAVGFCQSALTVDSQLVPGLMLVPSAKDLAILDSPATANLSAQTGALPVLTRASDVHRLKREEALRQYHVKIRGVITSVLPEHQAFMIEDSTRGIYVEDISTNRSGAPHIGDFLEVDGFTDAKDFAPIVRAQQVRNLGVGPLPNPVLPTWDQLLNGSLDGQYVELQGVITAVDPQGVTLRTGGGTIRVGLRVTGMKPEELTCYENALLRLRGCLCATWDYVTHEVKVGEVKLYDADVIVDQPAPADLFSSPRKTAAELLLFDPQASVFQRVKVRGQIVHVREGEYFMMDDGNGLRFIAKQPVELVPGDLVDVVGFPELSGGAAPVLREAVVRKSGHGPLPQVRSIPPEELFKPELDSRLVRVEGVLLSARPAGNSLVLELQSRLRTFVARLREGADERVRSLAVGSRLELTGVYAALGGNRAGQGVASFELLLNSPSDIRVLARPPWWTLERLLVIVGALACVLAVSALWITQLHRKVEERTAQLEIQILERERVEHQRAIEQERARVAQDLHDELGSGLTEISMLAERARAATVPEPRRTGHLGQVGDKAREMVTALDEIVWAMNPGHDSLASLVSYFRLYADRFLGLANIAWRFEGPSDAADCELDSRRRHQLFLAYKEALTNIVRHSGASEVRLAVRIQDQVMQITVEDNGRGIPAGIRTEQMDGIANMRARIEKLGGRFEIDSQSGSGTRLQFYVPLTEKL
jgi:signal transduction histidine kinase